MDPMSKAELIFAVCVALLTFPLVQLSHSGAGTKGLIRQSIGDIASAREDYDAGKINIASPLGQGLVGKKVDEVAEIEVPAGVNKFKILEIRFDEE